MTSEAFNVYSKRTDRHHSVMTKTDQIALLRILRMMVDSLPVDTRAVLGDEARKDSNMSPQYRIGWAIDMTREIVERAPCPGYRPAA
jgi:hypothetical protein